MIASVSWSRMTRLPSMAEAAPRMALFERYLTLWVLMCIVVGTLLGHLLPDAFSRLATWRLRRSISRLPC